MATQHIRPHDEDVMSSLTRVIGAIEVVKNVVPTQLGQGVLSTTSAILVVVKVSFTLALLLYKPRKLICDPCSGYDQEQRRLSRPHRPMRYYAQAH
jgi:hypothetical protein